MGSRKRLVLASLISLMVALAFMIGLAPSYTTLGANAAVGAGGRVDIRGLLDAVLGLKQGDPVQSIAVTRPATETVVRVADGSVAVYMPFEAVAVGDAAPVMYGIDPDEPDYQWTGSTNWIGNWISNTPGDEPPYRATFDLWGVVNSMTGTQASFLVYAFANASWNTFKAAEVEYTVRSDGPYDLPDPQETRLWIEKMDPSIDDDMNGLPFMMFTMVPPGNTWLAAYEYPIYDENGVQIGTGVRSVAIANLDTSTAKQTPVGVDVSPRPDVNITTPTLQQFVDAGLIYSGESGLVIASVGEDLSLMLDQVDGDNSPAALGGWAATANLYAPPGGTILNSGTNDPYYIGVNIVATNDGGAGIDYYEINDLGDLTVDFDITEMRLEDGWDVSLWSLPSQIVSPSDYVYLFANAGAAYETYTWRLKALRDPAVSGPAVNGRFLASVHTLSIFSAFKNAMAIYGVYPNRGPVAQETPNVEIVGDFGFTTAQTLSELNAAIRVYFGGMQAEITSGLALTKAASSFYVTAPPYPTAGPVDVTVWDLTKPANCAIEADGFTYLNQYTLTVLYAGTGTGTVARVPDQTVFLDGDSVQLTATPNAGSTFTEWQGDLTGSANPATLLMNSNKTVTAVFDIPGYVLTTAVDPVGGGSITRNPDLPAYPAGSTVQLTAVPALGYVFVGWSGDGAGTANPLTITMDSDKNVTAHFALANFTLTVTPSDGGTVTLNPPGGVYPAGQIVQVTAVPDPTFSFHHWVGDVDFASTTNPNQVTMDSNKTIQAIFTTPAPVITSITPDRAWLFGGITARIQGTGFVDGTSTVTLNGQNVEVISISEPSDIYVIIPALEDTSPAYAQYKDVDLVVTNSPGDPSQTDTLDNGFRFWRFETDGGVTTTAFYFDTLVSGGPEAIDLALNDVLGMAKLYLPRATMGGGKCSVPDTGYGLARASKVPATVHTDEIDAGAGSAAVANNWDFGIHLYQSTWPDGTTWNTDTVGVAVYPEIQGWAYERTAAAQDDPTLRAALEFPVTDTALSATDVRNGLTLWSIDTSFAYNSGTTTTLPGGSTYQSTLLGGEVDPAVTETTDGATELDTVVARIYDLSAFSLRTGAALPTSLKQGIALATPDGTGHGPVRGGTAVTINCPNGGFAWTTIGFGNFPVDAYGNPLPANVSSYPHVTPDNLGESEFEIDLHSPAWSDLGIDEDVVVDIAIYLNGDLTTPAVVLQDVYRYEASTFDPTGILLVLLGLGVAIIGLAAGGDSGGGGGGPCFIATAAYGTPMAADIDTLRSFRDTYLLNNAAGTAFVDAYYSVSPYIADAVAKSPALAAVVRVMLVPIVAVVKVVQMAPMASVLMMALGLMGLIARRRRSKA